VTVFMGTIIFFVEVKCNNAFGECAYMYLCRCIIIMLSGAFFILMVSVVMLNVVMLNVVAPHKLPKCTVSLDFNNKYCLN